MVALLKLGHDFHGSIPSKQLHVQFDSSVIKLVLQV